MLMEFVSVIDGNWFVIVILILVFVFVIVCLVDDMFGCCDSICVGMLGMLVLGGVGICVLVLDSRLFSVLWLMLVSVMSLLMFCVYCVCWFFSVLMVFFIVVCVCVKLVGVIKFVWNLCLVSCSVFCWDDSVVVLMLISVLYLCCCKYVLVILVVSDMCVLC